MRFSKIGPSSASWHEARAGLDGLDCDECGEGDHGKAAIPHLCICSGKQSRTAK